MSLSTYLSLAFIAKFKPILVNDFNKFDTVHLMIFSVWFPGMNCIIEVMDAYTIKYFLSVCCLICKIEIIFLLEKAELLKSNHKIYVKTHEVGECSDGPHVLQGSVLHFSLSSFHTFS